MNEKSLARQLENLWSGGAVTLVGANETGGTTKLILDSLRHPSMPFAGTINVVTRRGGSVYGIPAVPSLAEVPGRIGLLWLLMRGEFVLDTLRALEAAPERLPTGVIVFAGDFPDPAAGVDHVAELVAWSRRTGVPLLGPQSVGAASFHHGINALDLPVGAAPRRGGIAVVSQSGGVLGLMLRGYREAGLGLHSAYSLGNQATFSWAQLTAALLEDPDVRALALYVEGIGSVAEFAAVADRAAERGTPIVLLLGGQTDAGASRAASHTGAIATPARLVRGICEQYGVVLVQDPDELTASLLALESVGHARLGDAGAALFSGTGGGGVLFADAFARHGIPLPEPSAATRELVLGPGAHDGPANPLDLGAGLIGRPDHYREVVSAFVADPAYAIGVQVITFTPAPDDPPSFRWQLDEAIRATTAAGRHPFVAILMDDAPVLPDGDIPVTVGYGVHDTMIKLRALRAWSRGAAGQAPSAGGEVVPAALGGTRLADRAELAELLAGVPLRHPGEWTIGPADDLAAALDDVRFPCVAKAETGSAHRVREGAVITVVPDRRAGAAAVDYLRTLFGVPVTLAEFVTHDEEFFVGLSREPGGAPLIAVGPGGSGVEDKDVGVRLLPLGRAQLDRLLERYLPSQRGADDLAEVVTALAGLMADPRVDSIDCNPIVRDGAGRIVALDAKIHLRA